MSLTLTRTTPASGKASSLVKRALGADILGMVVGTAGPRLATLVIVPFGLHSYGSRLMGIIFLIEALSFYFQILGGSFLPSFGSKFVVTRDVDSLKQIWGVNIVLSLAAFVLFIGLVAMIDPTNELIWLAGSINIVAVSMNPAWTLRGSGQTKHFLVGAGVQVGVQWVLLAVFFVALQQPEWYFLSQAGAGLVAFCYSVLVPKTRPSFREFCHVWEARHIAGSSFAIQSYTNADLLLIVNILGAAKAGVYGAGYKYHNTSAAVYGVITQLLLPRWRQIKALGLQSCVKLFASVGGFWACATATTCGFLAPHLPEQYRVVCVLVTILAGQLVAAYTALIPAVSLLVGNQPQYLRVTIATAMANIGGNLVLIPTLGLRGAALATAGSELLAWRLVRRHCDFACRGDSWRLVLGLLLSQGAWITGQPLLAALGLPLFAWDLCLRVRELRASLPVGERRV